MKKIIALCLTLMMIVSVLTACGSKKSGDPYTMTNVVVETLIDPEAGTEESASKYQETLFSGEVTVYSETGKITLKDVILAYCDENNVDNTYNEDRNQFTKIGDLPANGGKYWNFSVNGKDSKLSEEVQLEDKIVISYTK